jgi:hypothetical protein
MANKEAFEQWAKPILGDNPTWTESGQCELAWQAWQAAVKVEREANAKVCEKEAVFLNDDRGAEQAASICAYSIRARSNVELTGAAQPHRAASALTDGL